MRVRVAVVVVVVGAGGFSGGGFSKKLVVYFLQVFSFHVGGEERWELCGV